MSLIPWKAGSPACDDTIAAAKRRTPANEMPRVTIRLRTKQQQDGMANMVKQMKEDGCKLASGSVVRDGADALLYVLEQSAIPADLVPRAVESNWEKEAEAVAEESDPEKPSLEDRIAGLS